MSKLKVSALKDLTGAHGFMLAGGGITASTTLTCSNVVINGDIRGGSAGAPKARVQPIGNDI